MNGEDRYLSEEWVQLVERLAVGIQLVDAVRSRPAEGDLRVVVENVATPHPIPRGTGTFGDYRVDLNLPRLRSHRESRFVITYRGRPRPKMTLRVLDPGRRFVPRRFTVPVDDEETVRIAERASRQPLWPRTPSRGRRVALFPGARYNAASVTGIRGRVVRQGQPVPWVRVKASHPASSASVLGVAHGDDRGEFLLLIRPHALQLEDEPSMNYPVHVVVSAPPDVPSSSPGGPADPLVALPIEELPPPGALDNVSPGTRPPDIYEPAAPRMVMCRLGVVVAHTTPFELG